MEEWRDIKGYEGRYQISSQGRIKSLDIYTIDTIGRRQLHRGKFLKSHYDKDGYEKITLYDGKFYSIHRLVAETFIPNPNNYPIINHKDENKHNNMVWVNEDGSIDYDKSNLEWCTYKYNANYGTAIDRRKANMDYAEAAKKRHKRIIQNTLNDVYIKEWNSIKEASYYLNLDKGSICKCLKGKVKTCGGYKWKYAE